MNGTDKRDRAVEQLLRQSLSSSPDEATDVCLDAETIAAWMDGGLSGAALEPAQMHAADCARCQALLATFAQLNTPVPAPVPESRRWFAWLVPLTAAAAIATWVLLPRSPQQEVPAQAGTMARNDEARAIAPPEAAREPSPQPPAAPPDPALAPSAPAVRPSAQAPAQTLAAPRESTPPPADRREVDRFASGAVEDRAKAAAGNAVAASPPPAVGGLTPAAPPPAPAASGALEERVTIAAAPVAQSAGSTVQWRVSGPRIEQSVDRGMTWTTVYTAPAALTSIATPSAGIVWATGRGGVVLTSTDGRNFTRRPFPETVDLVAVRATDATSASVTTADGRTLTTTDAGATWRTPLQDF